MIKWFRRRVSQAESRLHKALWIAGVPLAVVVLVLLGLGWYWSREPATFWVNETITGGGVTPTRAAPQATGSGAAETRAGAAETAAGAAETGAGAAETGAGAAETAAGAAETGSGAAETGSGAAETAAAATGAAAGGRAVVGYSTTETLIRVVDWLLEKPGGYLSNDVLPPGVWLDNMPNFEFGVLVQCRDLARVLRNDYSRSQSQSTEDPDLAVAEPDLNFSNDSWIFPATESKYREALASLESYRDRLTDPEHPDARFYARADNLREWLFVVERRLGSLSQRLSASVSRPRVNTDLAGEPAAAESTARPEDVDVRTPFLEIDDVFYEARGTAWALLHFMRAAQFDFQGVLKDKNAVVSIRQIIRELEGALQPVRSPMILNGSGYGVFANHSLVLASYLSRAHSAVIDLRELLEQG